MELEIGSILEGKVSGTTKFGAFVMLPEGRSGLVHISEIAYTYVNDVKDHLQEGQEVKVKVIGVDDAGRINLSIKKAMEPLYTSKPSRERSGMGFSFMEAFMDEVWVDSEPGRGTVVRMVKRLEERPAR